MRILQSFYFSNYISFSFVFTLVFLCRGLRHANCSLSIFSLFHFSIFHLLSFYLFCARQLDSHIHKDKNSPTLGWIFILERMMRILQSFYFSNYISFSFVFTLVFLCRGLRHANCSLSIFSLFHFSIFHLLSFYLFCARQLDSHIHKDKNSPTLGWIFILERMMRIELTN